VPVVNRVTNPRARLMVLLFIIIVVMMLAIGIIGTITRRVVRQLVRAAD
jgi:hypothetical protein